MTTEVTEQNRVIAEFMGLYRSDGQDFGGQEREMWFDKRTNIRKVDGFLKYHEDWNMLMPIIEKISKIKIEPHEQHIDYHYPRTFGMPDNEGRPMFRFNCGTLFTGETLIEAAHKAVYDFIQWYQSSLNTQNK